MSEAAADEQPLTEIATGLALVTMGLLAMVLYAAGVSWWWMAFVLGGGLIPLANGLASWYADGEPREANGQTDETQDALAELRSRYARGELTEAEFETRLERLLQTETVDDAHESLSRSQTVAADGERDSNREREHE